MKKSTFWNTKGSSAVCTIVSIKQHEHLRCTSIMHFFYTSREECNTSEFPETEQATKTPKTATNIIMHLIQMGNSVHMHNICPVNWYTCFYANHQCYYKRYIPQEYSWMNQQTAKAIVVNAGLTFSFPISSEISRKPLWLSRSSPSLNVPLAVLKWHQRSKTSSIKLVYSKNRKLNIELTIKSKALQNDTWSGTTRDLQMSSPSHQTIRR